MKTHDLALACCLLFACAPTELHEATSPTICNSLPDDPRFAALYTSPVVVTAAEKPANRRSLDVDRSRIEGADVRFVRRPEAPPHILARAMACHAGGYDVRALAAAAPASDPLRPRSGNVIVSVEEEDGSLFVRIRSSRPETAEEILDHAKALAVRSRSDT